MPRRLRPSIVTPWPVPFDALAELDWGRPDYARRLLLEHLDQGHDGATRRRRVVDAHLRRLVRLIPKPPSRVLDAGCGPGFYAVPLAAAGHDVTGVDVSGPALRHARQLARGRPLAGRARFVKGDLRDVGLPAARFEAALLIYYVLEAFPRRAQPEVLRRIAAALVPGGRLIAELRLRPGQPPGRIDWWDVVSRSVLGDRRHLLLGDAAWDPRRRTYVLRELAVFDDGTLAVQQTSGWLCPFEEIPHLFSRGGFEVIAVYDAWSRVRANPFSDSVLVVARATG